MSKPLVSIGISFKNPGDYFRLALQSVFAQSFTDWELILVDDGSTDDSETLAETLADRRVTLHTDNLSRNLNVRLNQMVRMARGKYFFRMDADDVMHPDRLARQVQVLEQASETTVVGAAAYSIDSQSKIVGFRPVRTRQREGFAARHSFIHPTVAASRKWFLENPYSELVTYHRAEDAELWCRTSKKSTFYSVEEPLLFYRESDTFSFPKYLGAALGNISLAQEYAFSRSLMLKQVTREVAKLWLTSALYGLGRVDLVVNRRYQPVSETQRSESQTVLDAISNYPLPRLRELSAA